jgi:hypothetical protein
MASGELHPEREEQIMIGLLRERGGIDPGMVGPVLDLAAIGLVNGTWRNTCVETWHMQGRMRDGDMLRVNAHATWRARQLVRRWARDIGLDAAGPTSALDGVTEDAVWWLARRLHLWLVSPRRELPTGMTLVQLAGDDLPEYEADAYDSLRAFGEQAEDYGVRFGFVRTAVHGALACSHWWGHPHWAVQVDRFMRALDDPADEHWGVGGEHRIRLSAEPLEVGDRARLRRLLLSRPWDLSTDTAQWLVRAGIRYVTVS